MNNSPVTKIKERLSIEEVVSSYTELIQAGNNLKARCPFHNEKTASFFVSPDRGTYYCFGCGASGDIFSFVEEFEGLDFKGALRLLAERAGISLAEYRLGTKQEEDSKERLYLVMEEASKFFSANLKAHREVFDYLKSRGLSEKSISDFAIGFVPNEWRLLYNHLKSKHFSDQDIEIAGLAKKTDKGFYDRFRGRVMFPLFDSSKRIVAFSGRLFEDDGKSAKYLNSPETPIFSKHALLYGIDKAKESIKKNNFSILVEGQIDLVLAHQAGFRNTVATSGTALSDSVTTLDNSVSNLGLVRRLSNNIVLAFDADRAGVKASERATKIALGLGMDVKVAKMPKGMDPADLISKNGPDAWREAIRNSVHIIDFVLGLSVEAGGDDHHKIWRETKEKVLPYVASIESAIEQAYFIKKISDTVGIPVSAIEVDLKKIKNKAEPNEAESIEIEISHARKDRVLRKILGVIFWQRSLGNLSVLDTKKIINDLVLICEKKEEDLYKEFETQMADLIFEAEVFYEGEKDLGKDLGELLNNLESEILKEKLARKMLELSKAERDKDQSKSAEILKEINIINIKIEEIKNR